MMGKLIQLGAVIIKLLFRSKLQDKDRESFDDIVDMLTSFSLDEFEARDIERNFEKISDDVAASCKKILEKTSIKSGRADFIIENIVQSYKNANLTICKLLEKNISEEKIKQELIDCSDNFETLLDPNEIQLYERLLDHTTHFLVNAYIKFPEFSQEGIKRLNLKMDELVEKIENLIETMDKLDSFVSNKNQMVANYEHQYRSKIISQNDYVYLFGAGSLEREYKKYQLSIAYVELEIYDEYYDRQIKLREIFKNHKKIWLSGEAGLGKTTLLQWIAVKTAEKSKEILGLKNPIPVLIKLRQVDCSKLSLVEYFNSIMKDSSYKMPEGWIERLVKSGRFVFLIDGFDEINENEREKVFEWIESIDPRDRCKKIFTARPSVEKETYFDDVLEVKIQPMNRSRIKRFLFYWHKAVLEEQLKIDTDKALHMAEELDKKIRMSDSLFRLASVPLLCAMICALSYRNEMNLPSNKRELYEECCKMLIDRRDKEKSVPLNNLNINYEQKKLLLAKLAYWMMRNNYVEVNKTQAEDEIGRSASGMNILRGKITKQVVLQYLLERCGLLREPEKNKIDFIHRTFQEYLTAYAMSREEDWGVVKEKIGQSVWQETIGVCIGFAKKEIATDIITETLKKGKENQEEKKYLFMAASYINGAVEVEDELREKVQRRIEKMMPPQIEEIEEIAAAGDLAIQFLENTGLYDEKERIICLKILSRINSVKALEVSKSYYDHKLTINELKEMGEIYEEFSSQELAEYEIPQIVKQYITNICDENVSLHSIMLNILNSLANQDLEELQRKKIDGLHIVNCGRIKTSIARIFEDISTLSIIGICEAPDIIKNFNNLKRLYVINNKKEFSIYYFNKYPNIKTITEFYYVTDGREIIYGKDLVFLENCKKITIIPLNPQMELHIEEFDNLPQLQELKIGADLILDYNDIHIPRNIKKLILAVSKENMRYAKDMARYSGVEEKVEVENLEEIKKKIPSIFISLVK